MSVIEKQFLTYGSGITTDISQIPFDRFSDFAKTFPTSLRAVAGEAIYNVTVHDIDRDCFVARAPHTKSTSFPSFRAHNDVGNDSVFGMMIKSIVSSSSMTVTENLTLSFDQTPDNLIHHITIIIPTGSHVVITDELYTKEFYGSIIDVVVEDGAIVQYQIDPRQKTNVVCRLFRAYVKQNAQITWIEKVHNANVHLSSCQTYLEQEGAKGYIYGVFDQSQSSQTDIYAATYHLAPHTMSDSISKGVLRGSAKAVHRSLVHIASDAHDCEGYERQDTLLLSDSAQVNAIPNLEINNNQVKCSHGATTTYIDDEKLFYFLSRGLDKKTAEELFVSGHVSGIEEKYL